MQMPLAAKSNERQLCSQAMKVSDGIFLPLPPLLLGGYGDQTALYSQTLLCGHSLNVETSLQLTVFSALVVLKPIHFLDKIDPLNTDTLSWTVCPVLKVPIGILTSSTVQCLNEIFHVEFFSRWMVP